MRTSEDFPQHYQTCLMLHQLDSPAHYERLCESFEEAKDFTYQMKAFRRVINRECQRMPQRDDLGSVQDILRFYRFRLSSVAPTIICTKVALTKSHNI